MRDNHGWSPKARVVVHACEITCTAPLSRALEDKCPFLHATYSLFALDFFFFFARHYFRFFKKVNWKYMVTRGTTCTWESTPFHLLYMVQKN